MNSSADEKGRSLSFAEQSLQWEEEARVQAEEARRLRSLPPLYVIHTVHGTFAEKAEWIRETSGFCGRLADHLGGRVRIEPFTWTGKNNVAARWNAAQALKRHLESKLAEYKEAHHVVVAHSHGGNVAFMAFSSSHSAFAKVLGLTKDSPELVNRVLGVATLATPFLFARTRSIEMPLDAGAGFFAGLFAGWAILFFGYWRGMEWTLWPWAIAGAVCVVAILLVGEYITQSMKRHAHRICESIPKSTLKPEQVAIVRVEGDEALAAIAGARLAGTLADLIWRLSGVRAVKVANRLLTLFNYAGTQSRRRIAAEVAVATVTGNSSTVRVQESDLGDQISAAVMQALAIGTVITLTEGSPTEKLWTMILFGFYGLPAVLSVAVVLIWIPFALLGSVSLSPCGLSVPLAGPYLHMTAEPSPPNSWTVTYFDILGDSPPGLFHSEAYAHPLVPWFLADWIKERAKIKEQS